MGKIGKLRLIKKGTSVWSIANQSMIILVNDSIVEIAHTCYGNDVVFVKPMQILFPLTIPGIIGKGTDEWSVSYSFTKKYTMPEPTIFGYKKK